MRTLREDYAGHKQARSDMKELQNSKANVDYLLDVPARHEAREKSGKIGQ